MPFMSCKNNDIHSWEDAFAFVETVLSDVGLSVVMIVERGRFFGYGDTVCFCELGSESGTTKEADVTRLKQQYSSIILATGFDTVLIEDSTYSNPHTEAEGRGNIVLILVDRYQSWNYHTRGKKSREPPKLLQ